ncbi:MAG: hypothetical protein PHH26_05280, partial [Candidatus Thermoplasmatota archaeon]|nr:hypothetical protein [Candidatus Thermoplasmatota archaeon]
MCADPEKGWMPQSHEQAWMQKVAELTEQVQHLRQENERLNQALGWHAMEERKLRGLLSSCRTQIKAAMRAESLGLCKR